MDLDRLSIANEALVLVGEAPLSAFDGSTSAARLCAALLEVTLAAEIEARAWSFATKRVPLEAPSASGHPTLPHRFAIPAVAGGLVLRVLGVESPVGGEVVWRREGDAILADDAGPLTARVVWIEDGSLPRVNLTLAPLALSGAGANGDGVLAVCNAALAMIGRGPISALDEGTTEAQTCSRLFDLALRACVGERAWRFATRRFALLDAPTDSGDSDLPKKFAIPAVVIGLDGGSYEVLRVLAVDDGSGDFRLPFRCEGEAILASGEEIQVEALVVDASGGGGPILT